MAKKNPAVKTQMKTQLDMGYGWCRANQHIWVPQNGEIEVQGGAAKQVYLCNGCTSERHDWIVLKTGEIMRDYKYAQGYLVKIGGDERPRKNDWRKLHFNELVASQRLRRG